MFATFAIISTGICSVVAGALVGYQLKAYEVERERKKLLSDNNVHVDFKYTAHPEQFIEFLDRDIKVLNPEDSATITIKIIRGRGWKDMSTNVVFFKDIHAKAGDLTRVIKTLMLDDDSPLMTYRAHRTNKNAWGFLKERYGSESGMWWKDRNSPLNFEVTGIVTPKVLQKQENKEEIDAELVEAAKEVEDLLKGRYKKLESKKIQSKQ